MTIQFRMYAYIGWIWKLLFRLHILKTFYQYCCIKIINVLNLDKSLNWWIWYFCWSISLSTKRIFIVLILRYRIWTKAFLQTFFVLDYTNYTCNNLWAFALWLRSCYYHYTLPRNRKVCMYSYSILKHSWCMKETQHSSFEYVSCHVNHCLYKWKAFYM